MTNVPCVKECPKNTLDGWCPLLQCLWSNSTETVYCRLKSLHEKVSTSRKDCKIKLVKYDFLFGFFLQWGRSNKIMMFLFCLLIHEPREEFVAKATSVWDTNKQ